MKTKIYEEVKAAYLQQLKGSLQELQEGYQNAKTDVLQAEGRMVTRYDSMKTEMAWVANGLLAEIMKVEAALQTVNQQGNVQIGDNVRVLVQKAEQEVYSEQLCISVKQNLQDSTVRYVQPDTVEALSLLGQPVGSVVEVEQQNSSWTMQIVDCVKNAKQELVVDVDTVVVLEETGYGEELYYVTTMQGGIFLELENGAEIAVVSVKAPLARAVLGKKVGEQVVFRQGNLQRTLLVKDIIYQTL